MAYNLSPSKIIEFIINDFMDAWNSIAIRQDKKNLHKGNFLFALQAMILLEVICRLCYSDTTEKAIQDFSAELRRLDSRYFIKFPGLCLRPSKHHGKIEFLLPGQGSNSRCELIAVLFDLIRNGQAHQYQQTQAKLSDGKYLLLSLTGADLTLDQTFACGRPIDHLQIQRIGDGDIVIKIRTDVFFHDICEAMCKSNLLSQNLTLKYLLPRDYRISSTDLESCFRANGTERIN
jgi:hypothetical protein